MLVFSAIFKPTMEELARKKPAKQIIAEAGNA